MPMLDPRKRELWFLTGSQHLYGDETLKQVADDSRKIAEFLDRSGKLPVRVVWKPTLTGPEEILNTCIEANSAANCVGVVAWMHTFSPAKMWIAGLTRLEKPLAHLHTQFNRELPWSQIDMDFMNLNQSAHGDREFGFVVARLRLEHKIVVGHWQDSDVIADLAGWSRVATAAAASRSLKIVRFGGMDQLPGLACQRLMAAGYGFGAEGDWKTSALVRLMKVMSAGQGAGKAGVSFMEDYTYHLVKGEEKVLGAHMLEVCPSIADAADGKPSLEVHPLDIGGKAAPPRLV